MSSINSRTPPLRLAAVDSPSDGEVAAYQASSGQFEWVANGSGGGGTVTSVALTETGTALTITGSPITGAGTINIAGAGTSSQVILGDLTLGTLTSGTVTSVGTSQAFITITNPTTTPSISIGNASGAATGVLTATDWNTFNNKGSGTVTSVTGTAPIVSSGGITPAISLADTAVTPGTYTSADITVDAKGRITAASNGSGGGGGSPGGSDTQLQYNDGGSFGGISIMTYDDTATAEKIEIIGSSTETLMRIEQTGTGDALEVHDEATDTTVFKVDQSGHVQIGTTSETIGALRVNGYQGNSSVSGVSTYRISRLEDGVSGSLEITSSQSDSDMYVGAGSTGADLIFHTRRSSPSVANYENLRLTSNGEIGIEGSNFGTSGQVLTSGGSGAAASWTTVSGGGSSYNQARNPNGNIYTGYTTYFLSRGVGFTSIGQMTTTSSTRSGYSRQMFRPFIAPETGDITAFQAVVSTASVDTDIEVSIYNDNGGVPEDLLGKATIDCSSTGSKTQTTISATISLTEGVQYWYAWVSTNAIGSPTLRAEPQADTQFATGQTNNIAGTDYGVILIDLGSTYTTSTSITRTNLLPAGNSGGACRLGVKY